MIKTALDKALETANKTSSTEDVLTKIYGKKEPVKPVYSKPKRKRVTPVVPDGFPAGTTVNKNGIMSLPDGRQVQKIQGVEDVQVETA